MTSSLNAATILKDVVAFVEVWSSNKMENYSKTFAQQLLDMGAKVSKTFNKQVTHVVFKDGHQGTWKKAKKTGVKLVSVLWVERCKETGEHVEETMYQAVNESNELPQPVNKRTHRCMQPKDFEVRTPENDKRLQKKLDRMIKDLDEQKTSACTGVPVLPFDEDGSTAYSPTLAVPLRGDAMAQRLKEMKEKRENLSPTASQMIETSSSLSSYRPSIGNSPSMPFLQDLEEENKELNSSFRELCSKQIKNGTKNGIKSSKKTETGVNPVQKDGLQSKSEMEIPDKCIVANNNLKSCRTSHTPEREILERSVGIAKNTVEALPLMANEKPKRTAKMQQTKKKSKSFLNESPVKERPQADPHKQKTTERCKISLDNIAKTATGTLSNSILKYFESKDSSLLHTASANSSLHENKVVGKSKRVKSNRKSMPAVSHSDPSETHNTSLVKSSLSNNRTPTKSLNCSPALDEMLYEDYFSPVNIKESKSKARQTLVNLPSEISFFPPLLQQTRGKRKRSQKDTDETTNTSKRRSNVNHVQVPEIKAAEDASSEFAVKAMGKAFNESPGEKTTKIDLNIFSEDSVFFETKQNKTRITVANNNAHSLAKSRTSRCQSAASLNTPEQQKGLSRNNSLEFKFSAEQKGTTDTPFSMSLKNTISIEKGKFDHLRAEKQELSLLLVDLDGKDKIQNNCVQSVQRSESDTAACGERDSISETFSEHTHKCDKETMNKEKRKKPNRTLVMTSMPTDKQNTVIQVVDKLGGFSVADNVCETTTHVVTGGPRRTLNVLLGIARGCWILSFEWILWCVESEQWIPEEPYELSNHFPAAPICRLQRHLSAGEYQQDLFADQPVMYLSPVSQPPCDSLAELVLLCGGKVCKTVRQAGVCVGEYKGKIQPGTKYLSEQWILDCITQNKKLPFQNYYLD
ncbi:microcephalin isoform X1 [Acipenser ruthenus]|uniref:microcephalin isoform X1 n=1 Tax=Acipenser ruthenus TaxID=7906 RepID=UPI00274195B1|nr:microcephalin isoform X1 [Acipenser ruthenus]XP_033873185.3 microcephalin isoform X1 [Acipenser ruthenus]